MSSVIWHHDGVSDLNREGDEFSGVIVLSGSGFEDDSVGLAIGFAQDDAGGGFGLGFDFFYHDSVQQGYDSLEG